MLTSFYCTLYSL